MKRFLEKIKGFCEKFKFKSKKIKIFVGALLVVIIGSISVCFYSYSNQYIILFSNLDEGNIQTVVDTLKNEEDAIQFRNAFTIMGTYKAMGGDNL